MVNSWFRPRAKHFINALEALFMKRFFKGTLTFALVAFAFTLTTAESASAQKKIPPKKFGLSASLVSSSNYIQIPIWIGKKMVLAPKVSFDKKTGLTQIGAGADLRVYSKVGRICPFFGVGAKIRIDSPEVGDSENSISGMGFFGGEYYFHPLFGIGIQSGVGVTIPPGDDVDPTINTATSVFASIYF